MEQILDRYRGSRVSATVSYTERKRIIENRPRFFQYSIGISSSITSFYNSDDTNGGSWQKGSVINVNDKSGEKFLSNIISKNPPLFDDYIFNARYGHTYDFKVTNGTPKPIKGIDIYRGMPIGRTIKGQIVYSSARDIGNMAAGYVAAINGMSWGLSRIAFDTYQGGKEGLSTRNAEFFGWIIGHHITTNHQKEKNLLKSIGSLVNTIFRTIFK